MSLITITGHVLDPNGTPPDAVGNIHFLLNDWFKDSSNKIHVPKAEVATVAIADGAFSIQLESTKDASPSTRYYTVTYRGKHSSVEINYQLGKIQIRNTPSSQKLEDLLLDTLLTEATGSHIDRETPSGDVNSVNKLFQLAYTPVANSEQVFLNEYFQIVGDAYTISSTGLITFTLPPLTGDRIRVFYRVA